jgi:hypothetical protein
MNVLERIEWLLIGAGMRSVLRPADRETRNRDVEMRIENARIGYQAAITLWT